MARTPPPHYFPFPWAQYICLAAVLLANELTITFVSPMLPFLVLHLKLVEKKEDVGFYVGLIGSMFFLGRAVASHFWGMVGDLYGRKIVVYVSVLSSTIFLISFGWTNSLWVVLASRFLSGLFNGILGTARCMASELCHPSDQSRGQMFPSISLLIGLIMGPPVGGYLALPCAPSSPLAMPFDKEVLFCTYPFLLPSLAMAGIHILIILPAAIALRETNPKAPRKSCWGMPYSRGDSHCQGTAATFRKQDATYPPAIIGSKAAAEVPAGMTLQSSLVAKLVEFGPNGQDRLSAEANSLKGSGPILEDRAHEIGSSSSVELTQRQRLVGWYLMTAQAVFVFSHMIVDYSIPLLCITPINLGGLLWQADEIGQVYGILGAGTLLFSVSVGHRALQKIGPWRVFYISCACLAPMYLLIPQVNMAAGSATHTEFYMLALLLFCRQCFSIQIWAAVAIAMNNSLSPAVRCRLQGAGVALQSFLQIGSPALTGYTFSRSVGLLGALGVKVTFFLGSCFIVMISFFWRSCVPHEVDHQGRI